MRADALADEARCVLERGGGNAGKRNDDEHRHQSRTDGERQHAEQTARILCAVQKPVLGAVDQLSQEDGQLRGGRCCDKDRDNQKGSDTGEDRRFAGEGHIALFQGVADLLLGRFFCFAFLVGIIGHASPWH